MKSNYRRIGDFIKPIKKKNTDGKLSKLLGINIDKYFMPSVANVVGVNLKRYKVVQYNQFACNRMHVGRDMRLPVALSDSQEGFIVSPAYDVFEVTKPDELLPKYLMMWFSRAEFDRNTWFYTDADVRGGLSWAAFCDMTLPVPTIEKQRAIVKEYETITNRITLNEQLNQKLEATAQALYKHWFVDFEFPDENGLPYQSNGGEMVWNAVLEKDVPLGWEVGILSDILTLQRGFDLPKRKRIKGKYPLIASSGFAEFHNEFKVKGDGIVTGRSGALGGVFYIDEDFWPLNTTLYVKSFHHSKPLFAYFVLKNINIMDYKGGSAVPTLNRNHIHLHQMPIPPMKLIVEFELKCKILFQNKKQSKLENDYLYKLKNILLQKLVTT